jgi:hypothetical protein
MNDNELNKMSGFEVPDGYFENSKKSILNAIGAELSPTEFDVPEGFFEKNKSLILEQTKETKVVSIFSWKKVLIYAGSAAAIAVLTWQIIGNEKEVTQPSFADLLQQTDLNEETVLEDASLDELLNYYSTELEVIVADTTQKNQEQNVIDTKVDTLQKKLKTKENIKPKTRKDHPTINELSEEEILKYLIEEGGDSYEIQ